MELTTFYAESCHADPIKRALYGQKKGWSEGEYDVEKAAERHEHFAVARYVKAYADEYEVKSDRENKHEKEEKLGLIREEGQRVRFEEGKPLFSERPQFHGEINEEEEEDDRGEEGEEEERET